MRHWLCHHFVKPAGHLGYSQDGINNLDCGRVTLSNALRLPALLRQPPALLSLVVHARTRTRSSPFQA
eukprot:674191-Lingulodinium_polyedra.AAC.1